MRTCIPWSPSRTGRAGRLPVPTRPEPAPLPHFYMTPSRRRRFFHRLKHRRVSIAAGDHQRRYARGALLQADLGEVGPVVVDDACEVDDLGLAAQARLGAPKFAAHPVEGKRVGTRGDRCVERTSAGYNLCVVLTSLYLSCWRPWRPLRRTYLCLRT